MTTKLPCMLCGKITELGEESWCIGIWRSARTYRRDDFAYCADCGKKILKDLDKKRTKALEKWEKSIWPKG